MILSTKAFSGFRAIRPTWAKVRGDVSPSYGLPCTAIAAANHSPRRVVATPALLPNFETFMNFSFAGID